MKIKIGRFRFTAVWFKNFMLGPDLGKPVHQYKFDVKKRRRRIDFRIYILDRILWLSLYKHTRFGSKPLTETELKSLAHKLNSKQNPERSVATDDAQSDEAGKQKENQ